MITEQDVKDRLRQAEDRVEAAYRAAGSTVPCHEPEYLAARADLLAWIGVYWRVSAGVAPIIAVLTR